MNGKQLGWLHHAEMQEWVGDDWESILAELLDEEDEDLEEEEERQRIVDDYELFETDGLSPERKAAWDQSY